MAPQEEGPPAAGQLTAGLSAPTRMTGKPPDRRPPSHPAGALVHAHSSPTAPRIRAGLLRSSGSLTQQRLTANQNEKRKNRTPSQTAHTYLRTSLTLLITTCVCNTHGNHHFTRLYLWSGPARPAWVQAAPGRFGQKPPPQPHQVSAEHLSCPGPSARKVSRPRRVPKRP